VRDDRPTLLITGASGYLGSFLVPRARSAWRVIGTHLTAVPPAGLESYQLEIRDLVAVEELLRSLRPAIVIHTAYRQREPSVNLDGTRHLALACEQVGARLLLVSTDMVFGGRRGWYSETDPPSPVEPYGESKAAAEQEVLPRGGIVARTSLVYSFDPLDPNTHRLVAAPLQRGERPRLFVDEFRCPTYCPDLADALLELAGMDFQGIIHLSGPQRLSRYEFGSRLANVLGLDPAGIEPVQQGESGLIRPSDPSLDTSLARRALRTRLRSVDGVIGTQPQVGVPFRSG
jgi:dTDP-4-dehydrorhamnose reductase